MEKVCKKCGPKASPETLFHFGKEPKQLTKTAKNSFEDKIF